MGSKWRSLANEEIQKLLFANDERFTILTNESYNVPDATTTLFKTGSLFVALPTWGNVFNRMAC